MASSPKHKESPAEPFKRVLGLAVRAIAGDGEMQGNYAPGKPAPAGRHGEMQVTSAPGRPELDGKTVQLPEPSRLPSLKEIAVIRGWADSLALTAGCHDVKLHARLAPKGRPGPA